MIARRDGQGLVCQPTRNRVHSCYCCIVTGHDVTIESTLHLCDAMLGGSSNCYAGGAMARIGYARCSSQSQDLTVQQDRLKRAGCTIIRSEKVSGKSRDGRDELSSIMDFIRAGDELVVVKLD